MADVQPSALPGQTIVKLKPGASTQLPATHAGDGEGMNEMNASMGFMRQFLSAFRDNAETIRIFWCAAPCLDAALYQRWSEAATAPPHLLSASPCCASTVQLQHAHVLWQGFDLPQKLVYICRMGS